MDCDNNGFSDTSQSISGVIIGSGAQVTTWGPYSGVNVALTAGVPVLVIVELFDDVTSGDFNLRVEHITTSSPVSTPSPVVTPAPTLRPTLEPTFEYEIQSEAPTKAPTTPTTSSSVQTEAGILFPLTFFLVFF